MLYLLKRCIRTAARAHTHTHTHGLYDVTVKIIRLKSVEKVNKLEIQAGII